MLDITNHINITVMHNATTLRTNKTRNETTAEIARIRAAAQERKRKRLSTLHSCPQ